MSDARIEIFATCPQSADHAPAEYRRRVSDVARWSERYGCTGILVYSDNRLVDPWLTAQIIIESTEALCPLVAVQPAYMHPYTVANMVTSLAYVFDRRIYLNMVAGGFRNDLLALNDPTPHDDRYVRLTEYTTVIQQLLRGGPVTHAGKYYQVTNLSLKPILRPELFPGVFVSGSSPAGQAAARDLRATAIRYPKPAAEEDPAASDAGGSGMRMGIIARATEDEAWGVALERFPEDRKGQITHHLAMQVSDSHWHGQLSALSDEPVSDRNPYWLGPFKNYKSMCPYLVGSYGRVATELGRYLAAGYQTFILDIPPDEDELEHTAHAFRRVTQLVGT